MSFLITGDQQFYENLFLMQDTESSSLMQNISNDNEANAVPEKGAEDL